MSLYLRKRIRFPQLGTETRNLAPKPKPGPAKCPARGPGEPRAKRPKLTPDERAAQVARRVPTAVPRAYDPGCSVLAGRRTYTVRTWTRTDRYQWTVALARAGVDGATVVDHCPAMQDDGTPFVLHPAERGYSADWDSLWPDGRPITVSYSVTGTEAQHRTLTTCAATVVVSYGEASVARTAAGSGPDKIRPSGKPAKPKKHSPSEEWCKMSWLPADRVDTRPVIGTWGEPGYFCV
jgi:hypothetical protein